VLYNLEDFKKTTGDILRALRASEKARERTGSTRVEKRSTWPGKRAEQGAPVDTAVQKHLVTMRDESGYGTGSVRAAAQVAPSQK